MNQPLRVEPSELRAKAAAITEPWPLNPAYPSPPCALQLAEVAVQQIYQMATVMQEYISTGQAEAVRLSQSLNAAATAYETVDQRTSQALEQGQPVPSDPVVPAADLSPSVPLPPGVPIGACPAPDFKDVLTAATEINAPDQAATLHSFASAWSSYSGALNRRADSFQLDNVNWEGGAAEAAGTALRDHQQWLQEMADSCQQLAQQAEKLADAHRTGVSNHPTVAQVEEVVARIQTTQDPIQRAELMGFYEVLQAQSEQVLAKYAGDAIMKKIDPPAPPTGAPSLPPVTGNGDPQRRDQSDTDMSHMSEPGGAGGSPPTAPGGQAGTPPTSPSQMPQTAPAADAAGGSPAGGAPSGSPSGGSPSGGSQGGSPAGGMPGGLPGGSPSVKPSTPKLPGDPRLTPAASGGGGGGAGAGGGGGGGGVPDMPLSSAPTSGESTAPAPVQGAAAGPTRTGTAGAAPMGMGGGMAPMAGHRGGGESKEKARSPDLAPNEQIYAEDRPWTEAIIGQRRRRDTPESRESK